MNVLILNCILTTAEKGVITRRKSIKDCMISNFAMGMIANGHSVTIIASEEFKPTEKEDYQYDIIFMKSRLPQIFKPHLIPWPIGLRKYLKENIDKFDIVVVSEAFSMLALLAADICKDKLVIWQEMSFHQHLFFRLPAKIWYNVVPRYFMRKALVIGRSLPARDFIKKYARNVSEEIVDHGANANIFTIDEKSDNSFIIVARLVPGKNIDNMIRKFANFITKSSYKDFKLNIIGDGEERESLKMLIEELNMQNNIFLKGFMRHSEFRDYLRMAKGLLVDTIKDLNMVSIPEALISGTPILTNTLPTTVPFIRKYGLGIAKDNWDWEELQKMVERYDEFHENCREIRDELTNIGTSKKMIEIYKKWRIC